MPITRSGKVSEILTIWLFGLTCEKVGGDFQCHHGGARGSLSHSLSTRLIPAYGFTLVRLSVQSNRCTFVQSRAEGLPNTIRGRHSLVLNRVRLMPFSIAVFSSVGYHFKIQSIKNFDVHYNLFQKRLTAARKSVEISLCSIARPHRFVNPFSTPPVFLASSENGSLQRTCARRLINAASKPNSGD